MLDFAQVLQDHGRLLHGPPGLPRKIVLNDVRQLQNVCTVPQDTLKETFLDTAFETCLTTKDDEQLLFFFFFGHGDEDCFSWMIGQSQSLTRERFGEIITRARTQKPLLKIGVIMTSCYSGGWTAENPMNATMVVAAGDQEESNSFGCSASDESVVTFRDWSSRVTVDMEEMFSVGATPRFAARDGNWDASFEDATSVWRSRYRLTFEALPIVPTNPDSLFEEDSILDIRTGGRSDRGIDHLAGRLRALCLLYMRLRPGLNTAASNVWVHGLIASFYRPPPGKPFMKADSLMLWRSLRYRIGLAHLARLYVRRMQLHSFRSFDSYDEAEWLADASAPRKEAWGKALEVVLRLNLFPKPQVNRQGYPFRKPKSYLAAASIDQGLDILELDRRAIAAQQELFACCKPFSEVIG